MTYDPRTERIGYGGRRLGWGVRSFVSKTLAFAAAALLLAGAVAVSIVAFAVIMTGMLAVGAYLWWKTRDLRKDLHKQMRASSAEGNVIEGEVITRVVRDVEPHDRNSR